MKKIFRVGVLTGLAIVIALGFGRLPNVTDAAAGAFASVAVLVLVMSSAIAVLGSGLDRHFAIGCAITGWVYFWLTVEPDRTTSWLPTESLLRYLHGTAFALLQDFAVFRLLGHSVITLVVAILGGTLTCVTFGHND